MKCIIKSLLWGVSIAIIGASCSRPDKKYLITDHSVGNLTKEIPLSQLDSLYKNDSLVKTKISLQGTFRYISDERFLVYEKGKGKQLLELTPSISLEGDAQHIQEIQILDERFMTEQHLSLHSTFADIKKAYKDFDFEQLLTTVIVTPKGSNLSFAFAKEDLLPAVDDAYTIESIPDTAKIKRMTISWMN